MLPEPRSSLLHRIRASGIGRAMAERNYRLFTLGSIVSLIGQWTQRIAIGWLTWELTHSGTWLGLIAFADLFPTVVVTPFAGVIADRVDRRRMMIVTQFLAMLQAVALAILTVTGMIEIWSLFCLALFLGIVMSFNVAARLALMAGMSRRENLPAAIAISAAVFNGARFIGPAMGGLIIAMWGVGGAFMFNTASFCTLLIVIAAVAFGVKPYLELLPGVADQVYGGGARALAELTAATGLGALVMAVWLAQRGSVRGLTAITLASMAVGGGAIVLLSTTTVYWFGLICAIVTGAAMTTAGTGTQTLMQHAVAGPMRGRVMSLYGIIFRGAPAFGALLLGMLSEVIGLQAALALGGAMTIAVFLWLWRLRHRVGRAMERDPTDGKHA